jgi:hypothetical protein
MLIGLVIFNGHKNKEELNLPELVCMEKEPILVTQVQVMVLNIMVGLYT